MSELRKILASTRVLFLSLSCGLPLACSNADSSDSPLGDGGTVSEGASSSSGAAAGADDGATSGSGGGTGGKGLAGDSAGGAAGNAPMPQPFDIVSDGTAVDLFVGEADDPAVVRAASDLKTDIERVSGIVPRLRRTTTGLSSRAIFVGTLGKSPVIDALVEAGKLDVSQVEGRWESFAVQTVDDPAPGVSRALVIAGSDRRGAIFGAYDISELIGVSPWYWWADVTPLHRDVVTVDGAPRQQGEPSIKYRGIFINDEENFSAWSTQFDPGKKVGPEVYKKIFELLLRLKANLLWPAIKAVSDPFNKYPENGANADAYGIITSSSFANVKEWNAWAGAHKVDGVNPTYDYSVHEKIVYDFWDSMVTPNAKYERSYSVGMRGMNDTAMLSVDKPSIPERVDLLGQILLDQQKIFAARVPAALSPPLQTFMPYKETLDLYNEGLEVPDNVTLLWPEDNHGYVRQVPSAAERERGGGSGIYYHISYWGPPNQSYLWLNSTPLTLVREELQKGIDTGSSHFLMLNVGDIKPAEIGLEFAMRFAYRAGDYGDTNVATFLEKLAARDFSPEHAADIADIVMRYFQINIARRPEFMKKGIYSLTSYGDEGHRRWGELNDLLKRAEAISKKLPPERVDAFYEMVLFPLRASKLTLQKFVAADTADLYAAQGRRRSVKKRQESAASAHAAVVAELEYYNTELAGGKWNKIMNPFNPNMPGIGGLPGTADVPAAGTGSALGVVVEGQVEEGTASLQFSSYTEDVRFVDVFTKTDATFDWSSAVSDSWIKLSQSSGTINDEQRLEVSIDWAKAPAGTSSGTLKINGASATKSIAVKVSNPTTPSKTELDGYVEANGYVAIEAERFSARSDRGDSTWRVLTGLGRSGDSVKVFPDISDAVTKQLPSKAASLDYRIYFFSTGKFPVTVYRVPTLNGVGDCRFALALDDGEPTIIAGVKSVNEAGWRTTLLEQIEKLTTSIDVKTPGYHTLRLFKVDPSIAIDRIVIDTGGLQPSYLGPPESYWH
jgi:hypothetical protein